MHGRTTTRIGRIGGPAAGLGALGVALCALPGCGDREAPDVSAARDAGAVAEASATLEPTRDSRARGTVAFETADEGVRIRAELSGLPAGRHAFHVHEKGDCSAPDASSAGEHFDFESAEQPVRRITGNLGELEADDSGRAVLEALIPRAELEGRRSIVGRAVVVHARGNDPRQTPDGGAGDRIACGVITASR